MADSGNDRVREMAGFPPAEELGLTRARRQFLADTVVWIKRAYKENREWDCYVYASEVTDIHELLWLWLNLDAPERAAIKRFQLAERNYDAAHKRDDSK